VLFDRGRRGQALDAFDICCNCDRLNVFEVLIAGALSPCQELLDCPVQFASAFFPGIPMFELKGVTAINRNDTGRTALLGDLGFRVNLKAVGRAQPRLGFAFVFPLNNLERRNEHWATITSLVFDF
jgi:hypothetical protein